MIPRNAWAYVFTAVLFACGGTPSSQSGSEAKDDRDGASSTTTTPSQTTPAPPFTPGPSSTIGFQVTTVDARREPSVFAGCGRNDAPFTDKDRFLLRVVGQSDSVDAPFKTVVAVFDGTVERGVPHALVVTPSQSHGQQNADSEADRIGLTLFGTDLRNDAPIPTPIRAATVTVLDVAQAEGAPLTARIQMEFESGATFDATISGTLVSASGACAD